MMKLLHKGEELDLEAPLVIHLQLTTRCNLNCENCYYREGKDRDMDIEKLREAVNEWGWNKVKSVAIGGGEPMVYSPLPEVLNLLDDKKVAVTTNGLIRRDISVSRLHISIDRFHNSFSRLDELKKSIKFYKEKCDNVGINHIYSNEDDLERIRKLVDKYDLTLTLLREKPTGEFTKNLLGDEWIDACEEPKYCRQGKTSMYIDVDFNGSICSNIKKNRVEYTTLKETWKKIKNMECDLRGQG